MEEGGPAMSCAKKRRLEPDFDKCVELSADEIPPEVVVVKKDGIADGNRSLIGQIEQPRIGATMEEIRRLSDQELEDKIRRMSRMLKGFCPSKLPDKGEKLKANLRRHEEERDRRKQQSSIKVSYRCTEIEHAERSKSGEASVATRQEAPASQVHPNPEFVARLAQKLESGKASCTLVSDGFDRDLHLSSRDRRRKRKQKVNITHKRKEKNSLSWKEMGKARYNISSLHQSHPAENNGSLEQEGSFEGSHSDEFRSEKTVVLLDEEEPDIGDAAPTEQEAGLSGIIYYPSREDPDCVEIQYKDLECLAPGEYLTSPIINFYIRFLQGQFAAKNASSSYHFFNTYFYKKLQEAVLRQNADKEASFVKLRRWWKGVNIFRKAYIFLPIHDDLHWSLAIICNPDTEDDCGPIILHLDSLGYHSSRSIFQNIRRFLREEWNFLKEISDPADIPFTKRTWEHLPRRIEDKTIMVPQQRNDSDCGLFVLKFIERFIEEQGAAPQRPRKRNFGMFGKCWFRPAEASDLRREIKLKLEDEFRKAKGMLESSNQLSSGDSAEKPDEPAPSSVGSAEKPDEPSPSSSHSAVEPDESSPSSSDSAVEPAEPSAS